MSCLKCKTGAIPPENGARVPLCRQCRAELILSGEETRLTRMDLLWSDLNEQGRSAVNWGDLGNVEVLLRSNIEEKRLRCDICGASEPYNPMKARQGWTCERCHREGLACCMKMVVRELRPVSLCKFCRAELELSADSIEDAHKPLPGKENP